MFSIIVFDAENEFCLIGAGGFMNNLDVYIGDRIKQLRNQNGLTQQELADRTELTKGFISQLERGQSSASVETLSYIVTCLGTNLSDFFREELEEQMVFGEDDYFEKVSEDGNTVTWIVPSSQGMSLEPIIVTIEPGTQTVPDKAHEGEEFGYVLSGTVILHHGNTAQKVSKGESFIFRSDKIHYLSSASGKVAKVLWVSCPPSF